MIHPLRKPSPAVEPQVVQETGAVESCDAGVAMVETPTGLRCARRAVSCLVEPEVDDRVLVATDEEGRSFVLAVLERRAGAAVRLGAEGDVAWRVPGGSFWVAAKEGVTLATPGQTALTAGTLQITAGEAGLHLDKVSFLGRLVQAQAETVKLVAGALDQTLERVWHRVRRSYRFVAEQDHVRAGYLDYAAKENAQVRGKNTLVTAEQLVKVDGGQIHLG